MCSHMLSSMVMNLIFSDANFGLSPTKNDNLFSRYWRVLVRICDFYNDVYGTSYIGDLSCYVLLCLFDNLMDKPYLNVDD